MGEDPENTALEESSRGDAGCSVPSSSLSGAVAAIAEEGGIPAMSSTLWSKDGKRRMEAVVPVSSKHTGLTMGLIRQLFDLGGGRGTVRHLLLAIADDDGSVSLLRVFDYVQPPFEGPETFPEEMAMEDVDSDIE